MESSILRENAGRSPILLDVVGYFAEVVFPCGRRFLGYVAVKRTATEDIREVAAVCPSGGPWRECVLRTPGMPLRCRSACRVGAKIVGRSCRQYCDGQVQSHPLYQIHCGIDAASPLANSRWSKLPSMRRGPLRSGIERKTVKQHAQAVSLVEFR